MIECLDKTLYSTTLLKVGRFCTVILQSDWLRGKKRGQVWSVKHKMKVKGIGRAQRGVYSNHLVT